jgi:microcystin-dependent protein
MGISSGLSGAVGAVPIGSVTAFAGSSAPSGWLLCGGQVVSRTQYSGLFLTIGTTYGSGDGSTTFALPDLRGRTIAGEDDMGGTAANRLTTGGAGINGIALGATGGAETHTLTSAQMPSHTHTQNAHDHLLRFPGSVGGNRYIISDWGNAGSGTSFYNTTNWATLNTTLPGSYAVAEGATATNQSTGGGGAHNNTQPTMVLNYIIKAA